MSKTTAKNAILLVKGTILSTYATSFEVTDSTDPVETTGFGDGAKNFIPGLKTGSLMADLYWDSDAGKVHDTLKDITTAGGKGQATIIPEGYSFGANSISVNYMQASYGTGSDVASAISVGTIGFESTPTTAGGVPGLIHGQAIANATVTTSTTGASLDRSASSTGYKAILHCWAQTSGEVYTFTVEHSSNNSTWVLLDTFTLNGTAKGSEILYNLATSVNRYVRCKATCVTPGSSVSYTILFS